MAKLEPFVDKLEDLDWTPACELDACQAENPPATHHYLAEPVDHPRDHGRDKLVCKHCAERILVFEDSHQGTYLCRECNEPKFYAVSVRSIDGN